MQTATGIDENNLRLTGNKIKLTTRPKETQSTASSRCALLGKGYSSSRPVSAVPLLNLNYNEFEVDKTTRRPLSADFPFSRVKESSYRSSMSRSRYGSAYTDGETSLESGEETEGTLPSNHLLRNLLSEPLHSWRNGMRCKPSRKNKIFKKPTPKLNKTSDNSDSNETPSAGSDTSSSAESVAVKPQKLEVNTSTRFAEVKPQRLGLSNSPSSSPWLPNNTETKTINTDRQSEREKSQQLEETINPDIAINNVIIKSQQIHQYEQKSNEATNCLNEQCATINNAMVLVPGLKTKPPLPKKPDLNHLNAAKPIRKSNSPHPSPNEDVTKTNFEKIATNMLDYNLKTHRQEVYVEQQTTHSKITQENILERHDVNDHVSTSTLSSESDAMELKFQNWFREEQKTNNEILESEFNTDLSLHKLKKIDSDINEKESSNTSPTVNEKHSNLKGEVFPQTGNAKQISSAKAVNFETFDIQDLQRNYEKHKKYNTTKNFIKQNIKLTSNRNTKKPNSITEVPKKSQFVPTQMRAFRDYTEVENRDIESWMSSTDTDDLQTYTESAKPLSYLDFLNKIDELQESCGDASTEDTPEHVKNDEMTDQSDVNTYDDIVSILQVLEEEDKKSQMKMECIKEILNNELSSSEAEDNRNKVHCSTSSDEHNNKTVKTVHVSDVNLRQSNIDKDGSTLDNRYSDLNCSSHSKCREQEQPSRSSLNSSTNLNDIFSYLDEVDRNCAQSLACAKERLHSTVQVMESNIKLDTIPKLEELLAHTNVELAHHVIDVSLRLKEKSSSIALLQKELSTLRNQVTKMTKDTNEIVKQRLRTQKEDYENVVKRHQKFIDQLIADKKTLNQQCEGLIHEMKLLEDRYNSNLKATEHKHRTELQKVKEMHVAGEKMRRERWIDTKTQKIKELTVKGLEPELEKMAARHQQEISDLRSFHKREIEDLELRAARKTQQQCEALREQLTSEREKALAHERDVLRQRYEQLVESEEQTYQEHRRRLLAEHANKISECEERENGAIVERDRAIKQAQAEFEDKLQAAMRRHNSELNVLKEKTELEMEAFRNNYKKQMAVQLAEKEIQIREKCRKERDKEIEAVIERLEMKSNENKAQMEQSTENRIRRLKEKYENEIKDLEHLEKEATSKYSETKAKLLEADDAVISLKSSVKHLEMQLHDNKEFSERLSNERTKIKEIIKEEMKQEVQMLEKEVQELRNDKDKELQQVYARVKVAVARKDEALSELSRDHTALQEKCVYLENMLEQQRKDYLIK